MKMAEKGENAGNTRDNNKQPIHIQKIKQKETCFIIMPFDGNFEERYNMIYRPAILKAELEPKRADDLFRPGTIISDIWEMTKLATIILADLTNQNCNVYYALGLAHAIAKPVILITPSMEEVPFDLRSLRVLHYDINRHNWGDLLREAITTSILETIKSPIETVLATFLQAKPSTKSYDITEHEKRMLAMRQDIDLLLYEVRMMKELSQARSSPQFRDSFTGGYGGGGYG